jgi:hypothetical protein
MTKAYIHPVSVPFPSIIAPGVGTESVATKIPFATGVGTVATTTRRASEKASEKARKKSEHQLLDNLAEKEQHFKDMIEANIAFLKSQVSQNLHPTPTEPECKFAIAVSDDQTPGVSLGDYIRVEKDLSPGLNQLEGYGFVKKIQGVGA